MPICRQPFPIACGRSRQILALYSRGRSGDFEGTIFFSFNASNEITSEMMIRSTKDPRIDARYNRSIEATETKRNFVSERYASLIVNKGVKNSGIWKFQTTSIMAVYSIIFPRRGQLPEVKDTKWAVPESNRQRYEEGIRARDHNCCLLKTIAKTRQVFVAESERQDGWTVESL